MGELDLQVGIGGDAHVLIGGHEIGVDVEDGCVDAVGGEHDAAAAVLQGCLCHLAGPVHEVRPPVDAEHRRTLGPDVQFHARHGHLVGVEGCDLHAERPDFLEDGLVVGVDGVHGPVTCAGLIDPKLWLECGAVIPDRKCSHVSGVVGTRVQGGDGLLWPQHGQQGVDVLDGDELALDDLARVERMEGVSGAGDGKDLQVVVGIG
ncbi:MAG: hypothetical protein U0176_03080 [Bacteroidia bacterium]